GNASKPSGTKSRRCRPPAWTRTRRSTTSCRAPRTDIPLLMLVDASAIVAKGLRQTLDRLSCRGRPTTRELDQRLDHVPVRIMERIDIRPSGFGRAHEVRPAPCEPLAAELSDKQIGREAGEA